MIKLHHVLRKKINVKNSSKMAKRHILMTQVLLVVSTKYSDSALQLISVKISDSRFRYKITVVNPTMCGYHLSKPLLSSSGTHVTACRICLGRRGESKWRVNVRNALAICS